MERDTDHHAAMTQAGLNLIGQALSIYDADLRLAVCNAMFQRMFDLPQRLVTPGASFADTIRYLVERGEYGRGEDIDAFVAARVQQASTFEPHYMERRRSNGRVISVEGSPLPQGGWVTVYTDITEIKEQEALLRAHSAELSDQLVGHAERLGRVNRELAATFTALEDTKRQLTRTEARTRTVTEMMPAHIAHLDASGHYTYSNRRLSAVLPGAASDVVGLSMGQALGRDTFDKIEPCLARAKGGEACVKEFTHDESSRRIRVAFTPDTRQEGGVYILSMDVTEETQARAALTQTRKRELAAQLTSGMAHDFANLLTIIMGVQARLDRMDLRPEAHDMLGVAQAAARRGGALLDRIAAISGKREMRPKPMQMRALLSDLKTMATPSLPEGVRLAVEISGFDTPVLLDVGSVQDALLNLILNARDAVGDSGAITLSARPMRDTWIEFVVEDTGPGFSDSALAHGMDPFFTTKGDKGSGLGLSMVYDICQLSGGTTKLGNTDRGAKVTLRLPLRRPTKASASRMTLLVEDNDDIRASVRTMLTGLGHSVIEAGTVEEGLALAELPGLSCVLSDICLPGGASGLDLAYALSDRDRALPVHLMTALPVSDPKRQQAASRFPIIAKPFSAGELDGFLTREEAQ